ncbi:MAG: hypothetical protein HDS68_05225 [Bacteroidales bacterium]|nr:hypothetical protein [Bacteroidales bacterium]
MTITLFSASAKEISHIYDKPAATANEAIHIGNGTSAATIYGTFPDENVEINYTTPEGKTEKLATLTVFHSIPVKRKVKTYERGINKDTETAYIDMTLTDGTWKEQFYSAAKDSVLIVEYSDDLPLNSTVFLKSDYATDVKSFDDLITLKGKLPAQGRGEGTDFTMLLKVIPGTGGMITTNPDASLAICNIKGAKFIITTVRSQATDLANLRIFRTALRLKNGLDKYQQTAPVSQSDYSYAAYTTTEEKVTSPTGKQETFVNIEATDSLGNPVVALRTSPGRIEFLPYIDFTNATDGGIDNIKALDSFNICFRWEKGKVSGGTITYFRKDYMPDETEIDIVINGETHKVDIKEGETIPLENFIDLVRPFIQ